VSGDIGRVIDCGTHRNERTGIVHY
jgi:hypothetical protein